jgi:hypothetical protein
MLKDELCQNVYEAKARINNQVFDSLVEHKLLEHLLKRKGI